MICDKCHRRVLRQIREADAAGDGSLVNALCWWLHQQGLDSRWPVKLGVYRE